MQKLRLLLPLLLAAFTACEVPTATVTTDHTQAATALPADFEYPAHDTLTVLSWNVEHFVDEFDNPYITNWREDSAQGMAPRVQDFLAALRLADADVVVLQEFESKAFAQALAEQVPELSYQWFAAQESPDWYMNVVVMSRLPLGAVYGYGTVTTEAVGYTNEEGTSETQNHLNTRMLSVEVFVRPGVTLLLSGLHLKAGRGERNEALRLGQVHYLRSQLARFQQSNPEAPLLVVGDLNCTPNSAEFQALLGSEGAAPVLVDPWASDSLVYSHPADSPFWRIDHVLPSAAFAKQMVAPTEYRYFYDTARQRALADHLPAVAKFLVREEEK